MSLSDWLRSRRERAVIRRLCKLDSQIAYEQARLDELRRIYPGLATISGSQICEIGRIAGTIAKLKQIRGHNEKHQDTL